jgi:hypothetical protein
MHCEPLALIVYRTEGASIVVVVVVVVKKVLEAQTGTYQ